MMRLASHGPRTGAWRIGAALAFAAFAIAGSGNARADAGSVSGSGHGRLQLIMVDDPACRFCRKWDEAVGGGYAASPEGRAAPLKRVLRDASELENLTPVAYTPTFIVMRGDQEIGRISGYSGPKYFYEDLRDILAMAGTSVDAVP